MIVTVRFRGPLANQMEAGTDQIEIAEGSTLRELMVRLLDNDTVNGIWKTPEQIDRDTLILCNEADIGLTGGLETELKDGDILVILPLVHGG